MREATTRAELWQSLRRKGKVRIYGEFAVWLLAGLSVPGAGQGTRWELELDWIKIMKKQLSTDGNSKDSFGATDVKNPRA